MSSHNTSTTKRDTTDADTSCRCIVHENYFDLMRYMYSKCSLVDQLALFTFVDRYVAPNHVIFFLMKEALNMVRGREEWKQHRKRADGAAVEAYSAFRNLVTVNDGTADGLRRQKPVDFDPNTYDRPANTRRLYLNSRRDYADAIALLNNYESVDNNEDVELEDRRPETVKAHFRVLGGGHVALKDPVVKVSDDNYNDDENDDDDDDDDDNGADDEFYANDFNADDDLPYASEVRTSALEHRMMNSERQVEIMSKSLIRPPTARQRSRANNVRNTQTLFSKSERSVHQHYVETCRLLERFWSRCESENQLRRVDQQCSKVVTHVTYLIQSNNTRTNAVRSFELSTAVLCLFHETLTDTDSTPESRLLEQHTSLPINETWTLHHEDSCHNDRELNERENFARLLRIRVSKVRHNVNELVTRLQQNQSAQPSDTSTATPVGVIGLAPSDEKRLYQLAKFSPTGYPMSVADFRAQHQSEFALSSLERLVDTVVRLAHTPCIKLYDFVFTSTADFWSLMHQCLDYGIACYEKTGLYPTKHSLWDVGLVQRNELSLKRSYGVENTDYRLDDYHLLWFHSPTLLAGNLTVFVQSFRRLFLMCFNTSACFMLNRACARNRRKLGGKHECRLSKASMNAYYAVFLRMNVGHELLCKASIETMAEAIAWLERYAELTETLWLRLHVERPTYLARHLTNLRSRIRYDEAASAATAITTDWQKSSIDRQIDRPIGATAPAAKRRRLATEEIDDAEKHNVDVVDEDDDESVLDYAFENESNY